MTEPVVAQQILFAAVAGILILKYAALYSFVFAWARLQQRSYLMPVVYAFYAYLTAAALILVRASRFKLSQSHLQEKIMNWVQQEIRNTGRTLGLILGVLGLVMGGTIAAADGAGWKMPPDPEIVNFKRADAEIVTQTLVAPPFLPAHEQVADGPPRLVKIRMDIVEREIEIAPGVFVWQMAFNNSVPGPMPVVHQYDWVELTLQNGTSMGAGFTINTSSSPNIMLHNVDFHASAGALGGGELTKILPGQKVVLTWRAMKAGVFVYHCAPGGIMVPYHVVTGGNGALLVLPREGLRDGYGNPIRYDRAFYFGEQDYYVPKNPDGTWKRSKNFADQMGDMLKVMDGLIPTHVVFNGRTGALTTDIRLEAKVGETVLLLHSQANYPSWPHLIGGHGDWVWPYGKFNNQPDEGLESWDVVPGGTAAAVHTFYQPGLYVYLNHNLIMAFVKDAKAYIHVEGEWNNELMEQTTPPTAME